MPFESIPKWSYSAPFLVDTIATYVNKLWLFCEFNLFEKIGPVAWDYLVSSYVQVNE